MDGSTPFRRSLERALLVAATLAALGACTSDGDGSAATTRPNPPTTADSTTTTGAATTTLSAEEEVLAAYRDFWDVYIALGAMTGPFDAAAVDAILRRRATGEEYETLFNNTQADRAAGIVRTGTIDLAPSVVSIEGNRATVTDCYDDHIGVYRAATGERLDTDTPEPHHVTVTLVVEDGAWKVEQLVGAEGPCTR